MQLPIVAPAAVVTAHADACRDLFENRCQFRHFQHYLTGLMVLPNKSLTSIARCILESADKTTLARFLSDAPGCEAAVNAHRIRYVLHRTKHSRRPKAETALVLDDTLCEHVGSLFAYVAHHYNHSDGTYPLAHNPVTSFYVSGDVRFPLDLRLYRRYEEITQWEAFVAKHFPDRAIPTAKKARTRFDKEVDPLLLTDGAFAALPAQFRTKIALAIELLEAALRHKVPFDVVLFDGWYLAEDLVQVLSRRRKAWVSILKKNRNLETARFVLKDAAGTPNPLTGPHIAVEALIEHIRACAYRPVQGGTTTYWCFSLVVRIATLGRVRLVISFATAELSGTYAVLVTNRREWSAQKIIATYLRRWPRRSHWETLVSGVRGVFVLASGVSTRVTDKRERPRQNHRGSVSSASPGADSAIAALCPPAPHPGADRRSSICPPIRQAARAAVNVISAYDLLPKHNYRVKSARKESGVALRRKACYTLPCNGIV
jgi:hypothetical protein